MSAATHADDSASTVPFTEDNIVDQLGVKPNPAIVISALDGWGELRDGIEEGRDWSELEGIGPVTKETLNDTDPDTLPVDAGPETPPSPNGEEEDGDRDADSDSNDDNQEADAGDSAEVEAEAEAATAPEVEPDDADLESDEPDVDEDGDVDAANDEEDSGTDASAESSDTSEVESEDGEDDEVSLFDLKELPANFEASIELSRLKAVFNTISRLVDEAKIRIGEDRIVVRAVDPANVGMIDLDMQARAFQSFRANMGVIGVNVNRMVDVLGVGNSDDTVHLKLDTETRKLVVTVDGLEYTLALIDPASIRQEPEIPEIPLQSEVKMKGSVLSRAVKSADMVSEHIGFRYGGYDASFYADGDTDDVDFDLTTLDEVEEINNDAEGESLFSLDYLKDFDKMVPKSETITAEFGDEMPLKFFFNVADSHAQVETLLAPRIKSD